MNKKFEVEINEKMDVVYLITKYDDKEIERYSLNMYCVKCSGLVRREKDWINYYLICKCTKRIGYLDIGNIIEIMENKDGQETNESAVD